MILEFMTQRPFDITGQILTFEFILIGLLVLHIEWRDRNG